MAYIYDPDNKFGYKDELPITCDEKVIRGTDFDAEFLRIQAGVGDSFDETNAGLQQEIEDRIAGDQNLQDQINNLDNSEILGDLNAEIQARIEGDQNLQDQIDDLLAQPGAGMVISETEPTEEERVPGLQWLDSTTAEVWIWDGERWLEFPSAEGPAGPPGADGDAYWEQSGNNIYYDGGNVGVGTDDPKDKLHVEGGRLRVATVGSAEVSLVDTTAGFGFCESTISAVSTGNRRSSLILSTTDVSDGVVPRLTIDTKGNVGIGMDPVDGYGYTAEEQLAEWKEKAKKASWTAVTDGAFEEEPTEELVERWIETRALAVNLHLNGSVNAVDSVRASVLQTNNGNTAIGLQINGDTSRLYARANGTIYRELIGGIQFADSGIAPAHGFGVLDKDFDYDIGTNDYPFKDGYFSGTVTVGTALFADGNGTFTGTVTATSADFYGPITATGPMFFGNLTAEDAQFSGNLSANKIDASSTITQTTVGYGQIMLDGTNTSSEMQVICDNHTNLRFMNYNGSIIFQQGTDQSNKPFVIGADGNAQFAESLSVGGGDLTGTFAGAAPSVTVGATYGAKMSGSGSGIGLFGSNLVVNLADGLPVVQNTHSNYGAMGLSFGWGTMKIWRKGGAVTSGDAVEEIGTWNHEGLIVDGSVNINGDLLASKPDAGANAFAAGLDAGKTNQGGGAVAIGKDAGFEYQKPESVAVGHKAGYQNQGGGGVGIGFLAGAGDQGEYSIAIGYQASYDKQGEKSIAIGYMAGGTEQGDGSIVIKGGLGRQGGFRKEPNNISLSTSTGSLTYNGTDAWTFDGGTVNGLNGFRQNGAPVIDAKGLISTLSTLRKATMDETKDIRESLRSAIDELVAGFEQEIATMPAPEPEVSTMEIPE